MNQWWVIFKTWPWFPNCTNIEQSKICRICTHMSVIFPTFLSMAMAFFFFVLEFQKKIIRKFHSFGKNKFPQRLCGSKWQWHKLFLVVTIQGQMQWIDCQRERMKKLNHMKENDGQRTLFDIEVPRAWGSQNLDKCLWFYCPTIMNPWCNMSACLIDYSFTLLF